MSRSSGKVVADADIAPRVDEMTYDPQLRTAYCASGQGKISTVSLEGEKLTPLGDVESTQGCHSIIGCSKDASGVDCLRERRAEFRATFYASRTAYANKVAAGFSFQKQSSA
jgi:hypothetical protein